MSATVIAPAPIAPRAARRRSRAKPKPPRRRIVILSELRGLGGLVLEQALLDAAAPPQRSLVTWAERLSAELDVGPVREPATYRELMRAVVEIHRRAEADPARPPVALPRAA